MDSIERNSFRCASAPLVLLVLFGGAAAAHAQVLTYHIAGGAASDFGNAVSRAGDVDKDGYDDIVVGDADDTSGYGTGTVTIYSGRTGTFLDAAYGNFPSIAFGFAVDGDIDVDGDGYPDMLIGDPHESTNGPDAGRVTAYSPHRQLYVWDVGGPNTSGQFGHSVRTLGTDADGDGVEDFLVGSPYEHKARICSGATGATILTVSGQGGSFFGWSVSRGGDFDKDGTRDLLVGVPAYLDTGSGARLGRVTAFSGATGKKIWACDGPSDGSYFGWSLGLIGDVDNDGTADCVAGAPGAWDTTGTIQGGRASVISGATGAVLFTTYGDASGDGLGVSVRALGDMNSDGTPDFLVGAPGFGGYHTIAGYVRACSGIDGSTLCPYVLDPPDSSSYGYGSAVCAVDVDADGRNDVVIGAPHYETDNSGHGYGLVEVFTTIGATWSLYGAGWPGTIGVPTLTAANDPVVGASVTLDVGNSAGVSTFGMLAIGLSDTSIPTNKGGTLLVVPLLWIPLGIPAGGTTLSGTLPDDPSLYGVDAYFQLLEVDHGASKHLSFSRGLDLLFGFK